MPERRNRSAFTLIELLVVIAIIAILAAILFPVFALARENARQTACLSGERELGLALTLYSEDYDESLPAGTTGSLGQGWAGQIYPFVKSAALYRQTSQAFAALLPVQSVGVMGDARTYENVVAVRCVNTDDFSADAKRYVRRYGLTYTIVREQGRKVLNAWGGLPIPRIFFIDRNGKVVGQMQAEEDLPRFLKQLTAKA